MHGIAIGFHDVVDTGGLVRPIALGHTTRYTLARHEFCGHLNAIQARVGGQAVRRIDQPGTAGPRASVFLTFDDGTAGAYACVASELENRSWFGHFFVTTDWIGRAGFLSRQQIRELHQRGHLIGSHSRTHPERMSRLSREEALREWSESCELLGEVVGQQPRVASLPGGYYSRDVARAAAAAGIEVLFTSEPTTADLLIDGCLVLGRYSIHRDMPFQVSGRLAVGDRWAQLQQAGLWAAKKVVKGIAGGQYASLRRLLLNETW